MPNTKKNTKGTPELSEQEAEKLVYEAFKRSGAFVPQTPEDVLAAEAELDEARIELPQSLRDPMAILKRAVKPAVVLPFPIRPVADAEAIENLACAAKNGSIITSEVLQQMDADEQNAEAKRGAGDAKK